MECTPCGKATGSWQAVVRAEGSPVAGPDDCNASKGKELES